MSLMLVAARAALLKQASLRRAAVAAGSIAGAGAVGAGAAAALSKAPPAAADAVPDDPAAAARPFRTARDRLRGRLASLAAGGTGTVLGNWYSAATGKGAR